MIDGAFVKVAKALADPTRHQILREIRTAGEMTCTDVCDRFKLAQPTISHHLKTLAKAGVIDVRTDGQFHVLSVNEKVMREFAAELKPGATGASSKRGKKTAKKSKKKVGVGR